MNINCCEKDKLDEVMPYELSDANEAMATVADELEHEDVTKR